MHDKYLYEYAVIRLVPKVEREEFVNVGVIVFCKGNDFLKMLYQIDKNKIRSLSSENFSEEVEEEYEQYLNAFEKITNGEKECGPVSLMDVPSRFRWLTAVRSSVLQTSRPHPGFSTDLDQTLLRLFNELVI